MWTLIRVFCESLVSLRSKTLGYGNGLRPTLDLRMPMPSPAGAPRHTPPAHNTAIHQGHTRHRGTTATGHSPTATRTMPSPPTWPPPPPPTRTPMERCLDTGSHHIACLQRQSPRTLSPLADECCKNATNHHHQNNWHPHHHLHPPCMEAQTPCCHPTTPPHPKAPTSSSLRPRTTTAAHGQDQVL